MNRIISLNTIQLSLHFYKKLILISILITILMLISKVSFGIIVGLKLLLFCSLLLSYLSPKLKQQLIFYKNFGISKVFLFVTSFFIDTIFTGILVFIQQMF